MVECKNGYTSRDYPRNTPLLVGCVGSKVLMARLTDAQSQTRPAASLECEPNACISTTDKAVELANEHTHIFCTNSNIASGTTGNCKCEVIQGSNDEFDDDKLRAPESQTTTTSVATSASSGHRIAEFVSAGHMFLVALSTFV